MREAENVWFEEPCILYNFLWEIVREGQRTCGSKNRMFPVPSRGKQDARSRECAVLWGTVRERVHDGKRMCGSSSRTFSLLFCGRGYVRGRVHDRKRMCGSSSRTFSLQFVGDLVWERVHEKWREHAARRTAHRKYEVLRTSCLRTADWYTANVRFLEPHIWVPLTGYCKREVLRASRLRTSDWVLQT